ncbi:MAG: hypothetical protein KAY96_04270 [Bacteroidia bacterium]|nr:hypothetical protein [Bacteroidia bacterium]MBP6721473.1 hypothetical protein [Bacteroidia bacterium]MBP8073948.1 hypothetical protein [Bacteroidia bacterium]
MSGTSVGFIIEAASRLSFKERSTKIAGQDYDYKPESKIIFPFFRSLLAQHLSYLYVQKVSIFDLRDFGCVIIGGL